MALSKQEQTSQKWEAFCREYVSNGFNGSAAYSAVYPNAVDKTCRCNSYKLLQKPEIKARIDELIKEQYDALHINAERIATKLAEMAFAEKQDGIYTPTISLKALDMLQKQLGLQKQQIKQDVDLVTTIDVNITGEDVDGGSES